MVADRAGYLGHMPAFSARYYDYTQTLS